MGWVQLLLSTLCIVSDFVQEATFLRISALTTCRGLPSFAVAVSLSGSPLDETEEFHRANRFEYKGLDEEVAS